MGSSSRIDHLRMGHEGACHGKPLPFTAAEERPAGSDPSVQPVIQPLQQGRQAHCRERLPHLLFGVGIR